MSSTRSDQVVYTAGGKDCEVPGADVVVGLSMVRGGCPNRHGTANHTASTGTSLIDPPLERRDGEWQPPSEDLP